MNKDLGEQGIGAGDQENSLIPHSPLPLFVLDLRGVACPLNFVRTKMQLDKMNFGDILEVLLDSGEAIESVPPSIIEEGHEVLNQEQKEDHFKIIIRKN